MGDDFDTNGMNLMLVMKALDFAAQKHRRQKRKDAGGTPYINHPIKVAALLVKIGVENDAEVLASALLHDTLEDTKTSKEEIRKSFNEKVLAVVNEVTDNKKLPSPVRKRLQIKNAPQKSEAAKLIKLADLSCNLYDLVHSPPAKWNLARKQKYVGWAEEVANGLHGANDKLERIFNQHLAAAKKKYKLQKKF